MQNSYNLYVDKLQGEYRETFRAIEVYTGTITCTAEEVINERMQELLDVFFVAQEKGRSVESIVGKDIKKFCENFCTDFGKREKLQYFLNVVKQFAWLMFVMSILDAVFILSELSNNADFWQVKITAVPWEYVLAVLVFVPIHVLVSFAIRKNMFRKKNVNMKKYQVLQWVELVVVLLVGLGILFYLDFDVVEAPLWLMIVIFGGYLIGYYYFNRKWEKKRKENRIKFWDAVENELTVEEFDKELMKRFNRENKRRIRRGQDTATMEAFIDKLEKEWKKESKLFRYFEVFYLSLMLLVMLPSIIVNGVDWKELPWDVLPHVIGGALVGGWIVRNLMKSVQRIRNQWLMQKREEQTEDSNSKN